MKMVKKESNSNQIFTTYISNFSFFFQKISKNKKKMKKKGNPFQLLPKVLRKKIFLHLDVSSLLKMRLVSKLFKEMASDDIFWKEKFNNFFNKIIDKDYFNEILSESKNIYERTRSRFIVSPNLEGDSKREYNKTHSCVIF